MGADVTAVCMLVLTCKACIAEETCIVQKGRLEGLHRIVLWELTGVVHGRQRCYLGCRLEKPVKRGLTGRVPVRGCEREGRLTTRALGAKGKGKVGGLGAPGGHRGRR